MNADWDLDGLPLGLVDPMDRFRPRRELLDVPPANDWTADHRGPDPRFAGRVLYERARLALDDPDGEADAVAPLKPERAAWIVADAEVRALSRARDHRHDNRDLLVRLGADPGRISGRVPCPAHGGRDRNLAWRLTPDGRVLLKCHSHQCSFSEIVAAVR